MARQLRALRTPWALYILVGTAATACFAASHQWWATWGATAVQASAGLAVVLGVVRHRPARPLFWWLLAAGQLMYAAAQGYWRIRFDGSRGLIPFGDVNDLLYLAALILFIAALAVGPRPRARSRAGTIDSFAVVLGLAFGTWHLIAAPYVASGRLDSWGITVFLTYESLEVLRMAILVRILLGGRLTGAIALMTTGMLVQLTADLVYGVTLLAPSGPVDAWQNAGWIIGSVFIGAAGLYRDRRPEPETGTQEPDDTAAVSRLRLGTFLGLILVYPATTVLGAVLSGDYSPLSMTGSVLPMLLMVAVAALLIVRLGMLTSVAQQRTAEMRRALQSEHELRVKLAHQAGHDPLTGLANRRVLTDALADVSRRGTVFLIDLTGFKEINDRHGHPVGDAVLIGTAQRLTATAPDAIVARLGGDEFAVLDPARGAGADDLAARLIAALGRPHLIHGLELTSVGRLGHAALDGSTPADLMRDADLALYAAKKECSGAAVRFHPGLRDGWLRRTEISQGLTRALAGDGLALHYQPIVELATGRVTALEALMRFTPPGGSPVSPVEFIPVAEQSGLIIELGRFALRTACAQVRPWYLRHGVGVTVNVSVRQLTEPGFSDEVLTVLRDCALPGTALTLEITESMLIDTSGEISTAIVGALHELRSHGIRIAIDDFGTGYSSLAYLQELPIDVLKLDRSLTLSADPTPRQVAITRAAVDLGNALQLGTVAEGVESAEQARVLRDLGCPKAQGFHFARPLPAEQVDALLDSTARTTAAVPV
ncbi:bifunctional diguanylate cyclase/phosphodiesterase [Actinoplanes sp. DH11]|uniref:putative bifunctional diguanylate cyclase/phosphodiesterase n=1 Tax=Actinoplanes sp. DH11 TaxID=2857011 RepID=UPI001E285B8C|nr:GGDEF and EAL domain-containing protein [Actinoplanes sp. DH11]